MNNNAQRVDALVTQGWGRIAYNVVRSLARQGIRVGVGTDKFLGMTYFSRYTFKRFPHPLFTIQPKEFVQCVKEAIQQCQPRVYLPVDQDNLVVARYREEFEGLNVEIPIAPFETLRTLHKKDELARLAQSLGVPTPETIVPTTVADLLDFGNEFGFPVVIKKLSSSGARGVFYLDRQAFELIRHGKALPGGLAFGDFLAQRYVRGIGYGVSMLFNAGKIRAKFTHKRIRESCRTGGISTLRTGVINRNIEEYAQRLLESVRFHGVAMVEFKVDERTNQAWLLEVNPRFWGSLALAIQSGVDFPYLLYKIAIDGDVLPVMEYRLGLNVRWLLGDWQARVKQLRWAGDAPPSPRIDVRTSGYDDLYWDDPLPFLSEGVLSAWKYFTTASSQGEQTDVSLDQLEASYLAASR